MNGGIKIYCTNKTTNEYTDTNSRLDRLTYTNEKKVPIIIKENLNY